MSTAHELGEHADDQRSARERRTAAAHAVRQLTRTGSGQPRGALLDALLTRKAERIDGTPAGSLLDADAGHTPTLDGAATQDTYGYTPDNTDH